MSDYFGALMRSSGMAIGGSGPLRAQLQPEASNGVEIELEGDSTDRQTAAMQPTPTRQQTPAPLLLAQPAQQPAPTPAAVASPVADMPPMQSGLPHSPQIQLGDGPNAPADAAARPPSIAGVTTPAEPAPGNALLRAALQWVAADPQQIRASAPFVPLKQMPFAVGTEESVEESVGPPVVAAAVETERRAATSTQAAPEHPAPHLADALGAPFTRPARVTEATPPRPIAAADRDEVVEVSIGAIHVRVDAPAVQTVARPAATSPGAAPRASVAPQPARSALARRALRRI